MRTIGLIGGMSWQSSAVYYRLLNEEARRALGGHHSARCVLLSVNFDEIEALQRAGDWACLGRLMADCAQQLERAGAAFIVLCTNTMHRLAPEIEAAVRIPLLHIVDVTAQALHAAGHRRVGLLGTRYTMEQSFYTDRFKRLHDIEILVPEQGDRDEVNRVIYEELVFGETKGVSRAGYVQACERLASRGAEAILLGCTEIGLLLKPADVPMPLFDSTGLHAQAAIRESLKAGVIS
jgi:aspartate racemase